MGCKHVLRDSSEAKIILGRLKKLGMRGHIDVKMIKEARTGFVDLQNEGELIC